MFMCFTLGQCGSNMTETKLTDLLHGLKNVLTYEDKDGDWMLVGDVPYMWTWYKIQCKSVKIFRGEYRKETFSTLLSHFWVSTLSRETNRLRDASLSISPKSMRTLFVCLLLMIRHSKSAGIVLLLDRGSG